MILPNAYWGAGFSYELDLLVVRKTGYCLEFEIKQSFGDFKNDFKKYKWQKYKINGGLNKWIKEFSFVFPAELWHKRENDIRPLLPEFAGIFAVYNEGENKLPRARCIKSPKPNKHAVPMKENQRSDLARLAMIRFWDMKRTMLTT